MERRDFFIAGSVFLLTGCPDVGEEGQSEWSEKKDGETDKKVDPPLEPGAELIALSELYDPDFKEALELTNVRLLVNVLREKKLIYKDKLNRTKLKQLIEQDRVVVYRNMHYYELELFSYIYACYLHHAES